MRPFPATLLAGALLLCSACDGGGASGGRESAYDGPPILVIGVDGLEWKVLRPLMREGRTPNLAALLERGIGGFLETIQPTWSPVIWTTIATGREPQEHGILFFKEMTRDGRVIDDGLPYTSNSRRVPAVWNLADDHGIEVLSVAWWVSWPAEALRHGRVVASYAAQVQGDLLWKPGVWEEGLPELTWPPELQEELRPLLADGAPDGPLTERFQREFGAVPDDWEAAQKREVLFKTAYRGDATHARIFSHLLGQRAADLNLLYVGLPDVAGHYYWHDYEPEAYEYEIDADEREHHREHVPRAYEIVDRWIGEVLAAMPADTRVLVVSDHGMHAGNKKDPDAIQTGVHDDAPPGVILAAGPGIRPAGFIGRVGAGLGPLGTVHDVTPTLLWWLGLELGSSMTGRPMKKLMTEEWRTAHDVRRRLRPWSDGYREATPPRQPTEDASELFESRFLDELGYAETVENSEVEDG